MTGAEQAGIDEFFRKEELATCATRCGLCSSCTANPGAWERLQAEIARQRAIQKEELERRAKVPETILLALVGFLIVGVGGGGIILWIVDERHNLTNVHHTGLIGEFITCAAIMSLSQGWRVIHCRRSDRHHCVS